MAVLRVLAVLSFVLGGGLLVVGFLNQSNASTPRPPADIVEFDSTPTPTPEVTEVPVEATPTPAPFDGAVTRLKIPRFKVDSAIENIGLLANNQLDVPKNPHNTGWYDIYAKPGFRGNALFSAHVDYYPDIRGPFWELAKVEPNDDIVVAMENGLEYRYRVIKRVRYKVEEVPMGELIDAKDKPADVEWITLITCGGEFKPSYPGGPGEYLHRDVVIAERYQ